MDLGRTQNLAQSPTATTTEERVSSPSQINENQPEVMDQTVEPQPRQEGQQHPLEPAHEEVPQPEATDMMLENPDNDEPFHGFEEAVLRRRSGRIRRSPQRFRDLYALATSLLGIAPNHT